MSMEFQTRKAYATDLTDEQWAIVEPLMPAAKISSWRSAANDLYA